MVDVGQVPAENPLRVILGAGEQRYPGWLATGKEQLDLLRPEDFEASFTGRRVDAFLAEHVWEHLSEEEGRAAARLCYRWLRPGGLLRCAVPDANFPDEAYRRTVRVGGPGPADHPAADHRVLYDHVRLHDVFATAGFEVRLLEYCDEAGHVHYDPWDPGEGPIHRSLLADPRNGGGRLGFLSLILDARKPLG